MKTNDVDDTTVMSLVAGEFASLADDLETCEEAAWDAPSLCSQWSVREVVAHMTMAARYTDEAFGAKLAEHNFDFTELSMEVARVDGQRDPSQLLADLRSDSMANWTPPGGGPHGALNHAVVHGLDATSALGVKRSASSDALRVVLNDLTEGGVHNAFGITIDGLRFEATDQAWTFGDGDGNTIAGSASDLVLRLTGRRPLN